VARQCFQPQLAVGCPSSAWSPAAAAAHQQLLALLLPLLRGGAARRQLAGPVLQLGGPGAGGGQARLQAGQLLVALAQLG
jgi:hypothetical protein